MEKNSIMGVGVVGVGHLGKFHVQQYQTIQNVECVGLFDIDTKCADSISRKHNITSYNSLDDLLACCDAVSICTPTSTHYSVAAQALESGCHVFIEKPITTNIDEANKLISLSAKNNKLIQVGHIERFNPAFCAFKTKSFNPEFIESHRLAPFNIRGTDVDVILDLMIHDIDILLHIIQSDIKKINASGVSVLSKTIDMANARIEFTNGCVANLTASRISQKQLRKFRIFEKKVYTNIDFLNPCVETYMLSNQKPNKDCSYLVVNKNSEKFILYDKPTIVPHNALRVELENFLRSIEQCVPPVVSAEDGRAALEVAVQIREQINSKKS